jgi:hypothetical protein
MKKNKSLIVYNLITYLNKKVIALIMGLLSVKKKEESYQKEWENNQENSQSNKIKWKILKIMKIMKSRKMIKKLNINIILSYMMKIS